MKIGFFQKPRPAKEDLLKPAGRRKIGNRRERRSRKLKPYWTFQETKTFDDFAAYSSNQIELIILAGLEDSPTAGATARDLALAIRRLPFL
jgi:hypothetical protein